MSIPISDGFFPFPYFEWIFGGMGVGEMSLQQCEIISRIKYKKTKEYNLAGAVACVVSYTLNMSSWKSNLTKYHRRPCHL